MTKTKRQDFTDAQRAEIYVRDRAVCAFSGKSLWLLDYGISPTNDIDWVDHIKPASKGGGNDIENGICASSFYNSKKSDNSRDNKYLFHHGRPTTNFYYFNEFIPAAIADHLRRFSQLVESDWYFNRAAVRFIDGLWWLEGRKTGKVANSSRDDHAFAKSTLKALELWRRKSKDVDSFEVRGLVKNNLSEDQTELFKLREFTTVEEVLNHMHSNLVWYENGIQAIDAFSVAVSDDDMNAVVSKYLSMPKVPHRVLDILRHNQSRLSTSSDG